MIQAGADRRGRKGVSAKADLGASEEGGGLTRDFIGRDIGRDGALTGYGGGLWRKRFLLDLESGRRDAAPAEGPARRREGKP